MITVIISNWNKHLSFSVTVYEVVQWKEKKVTKDLVLRHEEVHRKENIFVIDSVSVIGSEI